MSDAFKEQLTRARKELLDLTGRNRLLNFRPTKRTTIQIVDEVPAQVWSRMVQDEKSFTFRAKEEHPLYRKSASKPQTAADAAHASYAPDDEAIDLSDGDVFDLPKNGNGGEAAKAGALGERYTDSNLQTMLSGGDLQTNLLRLEQQARSAVEERGVNILFLAVGFLKWRPEEASEETYLAPLVLVPVALERATAQHRFKLSALSDDPEINPCLAALLAQDFRIELPAMPEDWENEFDLDTFFTETTKRVAAQSGWEVLNSMCLGLFSFTKYMMYKDLDPARWPNVAGKGLLDNPWLRALLAPEQARAAQDLSDVPDPHDLDDAVHPAEAYHVLDADSSQLQAIAAAKLGKTLVVQGPPGTGKSQTIANIIAECLSEKKTALFVSEKMAALQVVKRRLDAVGLGDFCLELHSTKANRGAVVAELTRVLEKAQTAPAPEGGDADRLVQLRNRLTAYAKALHAKFDPAGLTPYEAMGRALRLGETPDVACAMPGFETWDPAQFVAMKEIIDRLSRCLRAVEPVGENAWRGARLTAVDVRISEAVRDALAGLPRLLAEVQSTAARVSETLGNGALATLCEMRDETEAGEIVASSPEPAERLLRENLWDGPNPERQQLLDQCDEYSESRRSLGKRFRMDQADALDTEALCRRYELHAKSIFRWFKSEYRRDRDAVRAMITPEQGRGMKALLPSLRELGGIQALMREIAPSGQKYFDDAWLGPKTDWESISKLAEWLPRFRAAVNSGRIGAAGIDLASRGRDRRDIAERAAEARAALNAWQAKWSEIVQLLLLQDPGVFKTPVERTPAVEIASRLAQMGEKQETLLDWARFQDALQRCEKSPLAEFAARAMQSGVPSEILAAAMEKRYLRLLVDRMFASREELRQFDAANHEEDRRAFAAADLKWVRGSSRRLQALLARERPLSGIKAAPSSQLGILQGELARKRSRKSIRQLFREAPEPIQRLKPCFMMSPLSVAQFIAPEGMRFDVVIFDEASQVEPADALGAVARGNQLLLLGDRNQLPPTSFFSAISGETSGPDDVGAAALGDVDSILDRAQGILPALSLNWHYRSRHESLIDFSNREFYANNLLVFPSCLSAGDALGLSLALEPSDVYDRGRSQTNRSQAKRVAEYVFRHAKSRPDKSLGVGAFSIKQQQAILDEIERLRRADPSAEPFFDVNRAEPFFVKNLETIQGDERDFIVLSIGFGKDTPGARLSMNFGPLNQDKGWRRLNVLITRAREKCVVFSSIAPEDFDLSATEAKGVRSLAGYLDFARTRKLPVVAGPQGDCESPFEQAVFDALSAQGVVLHKQVGCAGYAIDMAVVDPAKPGRYILGIECDGATYHSHATARDRDRLRQQVLEGLGWRLYRIWSTDWYRKPQQELQRALDAIRKAGEAPPDDAPKPAPVEPTPPSPAPPAPAEMPTPPPAPFASAEHSVVPPYQRYVPAPGNQPDTVERLIADIIACEGPIHEDELLRRLADFWGKKRLGPRMRENLLGRVASVVSAGGALRKGDFFWPSGMASPPVRRRIDESDRRIEAICREEIAQAAATALRLQFGMSREDLIVETARLLGFRRATPEIGQIINDAIDFASASGIIGARPS